MTPKYAPRLNTSKARHAALARKAGASPSPPPTFTFNH